MTPERDEGCRSCVHFRNDPAYLEAVLDGFTGLGSAYAATRSDDGLCLLHDRFVGPHGLCKNHRGEGPTARKAP